LSILKIEFHRINLSKKGFTHKTSIPANPIDQNLREEIGEFKEKAKEL
jgi:hypothetical protein